MRSPQHVLILTAGMGAGHDQVAAELAARLGEQGVESEVIDVLTLLPLRLGAALRASYSLMMRSTPWLYEGIYRTFFVSRHAPSTSPLVALAARRLERRIRERPPGRVVATFHLAAQVTGRLRESGRLPAPTTVLVTDFAVHRLWLHQGNDDHLCTDPVAAGEVTAALGRPAVNHAPLVRPEFGDGSGDAARCRALLQAGTGDRLVLVSAGSWGVGKVAETARVIAESGRYVPVVLCGGNERLRRRLSGTGLGHVLGWRKDMPDLMAAAHALVENAAGLTCREAFAAGLPVISYRPIAGHGRDGARAMSARGLSVYARTPAELLAALDRLREPSVRRGQADRAAGLFDAAPAEKIVASRLP
ncbi:galactosyldiacylglycerol synthase [Actinoallomurus acanthiterrae]